MSLLHNDNNNNLLLLDLYVDECRPICPCLHFVLSVFYMANALYRFLKMAAAGAALAHMFNQSTYTYVIQGSSCAGRELQLFPTLQCRHNKKEGTMKKFLQFEKKAVFCGLSQTDTARLQSL